MTRSLANTLMNRGNSSERQLGRLLSRGRLRGISEELNLAIATADRIIKDAGGPGGNAGAMQGAAVHTDVPGGPPRKKRSRLVTPHESN